MSAPVATQERIPARPVKLIVPVAAGGGIDTAFRTIAPFWSELLGQPIVIENKPGGRQIVGSDLVAKSKPDGHTLLGAGVPIAFNTALGRKLPALREKLQEQGLDIVASTPDAYAKLIRAEIDRWSKVVKDAGIVVD